MKSDAYEVVPAPTKAGFASIKTNQRKRLSKRELNIINQYDRSRVGAGNTMKSDANEVVPAPMREDTTRNAQPLDRAWNKLK
jgi:hypothetical protein